MIISRYPGRTEPKPGCTLPGGRHGRIRRHQHVATSVAYGLPAVGTMAHSFIEALPAEAEAFRTFARNTTGPVTFLVDTYDTERGVRIAASVLRELEDDRGFGVRLDSGD